MRRIYGAKVGVLTFYRKEGKVQVRIHPKSLKRFKDKAKGITSKSNVWSMEARIEKLNHAMHGWLGYFRIADMRGHCEKLDQWIRRRLRMCYWKQWKKIGTKHDNLVRLGVDNHKAWEFANTRKGCWRTSNSPI